MSTIPDQSVGTFALGRENIARHGKHFPALLNSETRRDAGPRAFSRFNHHHRDRKPGNNPVAGREIASFWWSAQGIIAEHCAFPCHLSRQTAVFSRVDFIHPAA